MDYRKEIDGLRAIAVLPVILFHAGFETFRGGFAGVDVFFVISGYLITSIILAELGQGNFSIIRFYERRARRILPALFLVMLACFPFAWFWLLPNDMKDFSQSLVAVSIFASNILFWRESGYFEAAAELKPLLHTWSLGVEEQYYVLFPLFLFLFWRLGKNRILAVLLVIFVASFSLAQWGSMSRPATFFLLPTRGWELLLGAFTAFYLSEAHRPQFSRGIREMAAWSGIVLILYAILTFSKSTPFPGFYALAPTVGTALVILFATQETSAGKFVGNRLFVGVGLISYSAYLWHQPLFAFARQRSLHEPDHTVFAALAVLALVLAYLSWRYVEAPFRQKGLLSAKQVFLFALLGSAFFFTVGMIGHVTKGAFMGRPNITMAISLDARTQPNYGLHTDCEGHYNDSAQCQTHPQPEVLVWGDSYAMHLVPGFIASNPDIRLIQKTVSACGSFLDIAPVTPEYPRSWAEQCIAFNDQVFDYLRSRQHIRYVVMASSWGQYAGSNVQVLTREGEIVYGHTIATEKMLSTISRIRALGKVPVVFSPIPQSGKNIARCLVKASYFGEDIALCDPRLSDSMKRQAAAWEFLDQVEQVTPVVRLTDFLCSADICKASYDDVLIYRDGGHMSYEGSAFLGQAMGFYSLLEQAGRADTTLK